MTTKKDPNLTRSQALALAWKNRKDYKGYDKSKGSLFNSWRSIVNTKKGILKGFPESWKKFENFKEDVGKDWEQNKVLCRINTKLPYSKENCEWRNKGEENISKLSTLTYNNITKTLLEWCQELNLNYNGVRQRFYSNKTYSAEQILFGKNLQFKKEITDIKTITEEYKKRSKVSKMLSAYRCKDYKHHRIFNIDKEWFYNQISTGSCVYCGSKNNLGLDRIDNNKGHTQDNVVLCCYDCNIVRNNLFSYEEMLVLGKTIKKIKAKRNENFYTK